MRPRNILVNVYRPYHDGNARFYEHHQARFTPEAVFIEAIDEHGEEVELTPAELAMAQIEANEKMGSRGAE